MGSKELFYHCEDDCSEERLQVNGLKKKHRVLQHWKTKLENGKPENVMHDKSW
ncbi:MAG: hypothetical protein MRJ93_11380 [Nitrososphaeraceae archaeon]|nr:hypothetical protein [Nitrososphaeraceae archaeon]